MVYYSASSACFPLKLSTFLTAENNLGTSISSVSPVVSNSADGQRYWGVAKSLVSNGSFSVSEDSNTPLRRAGPLTGLLFAQAIYVFGTDAGVPGHGRHHLGLGRRVVMDAA